MTRQERIKAALQGQEVDRVPCSVWMHLSDVDQDPVSLAEEMVARNEEFDAILRLHDTGLGRKNQDLL